MAARIAIDGAQCTGKTTLLAKLAPLFGPDLTSIEEASRVVAPKFGIRSSSDWGPVLASRAKLENFFRAEEEWLRQKQSQSHDRFIVDSSAMVIWAYRKHFGCNDPEDPVFSSSYDLVLYCPPLSNLSREDGFRFLEGRDSIDSIYRDIIRCRFGGLFMPLPNPQTRLADAVAAVGRLLG